MAQIVINEISQNYTYNTGNNSFATVALPITAMWGPGYTEPTDSGMTIDEMLEVTKWTHFPATQAGLESFVSTYRGPSSNYKLANDYSYQMAMTLLTAGYDVLTCRVCPGTYAEAALNLSKKSDQGSHFTIQAKYPGTFGNKLKVKLTRAKNGTYWNLVTYVMDTSGIQTAVENLVFVFDINNSTDSIPHIDEIDSKFLRIITDITTDDFDDNTAKVDFMLGDLNLNKELDADDLRILKDYLIGKSTLSGVQWDIADIHKDGSLNVFDSMALDHHIKEGIDPGVVGTGSIGDISVMLTGGTDFNLSDAKTVEKAWEKAKEYAEQRYTGSKIGDTNVGVGYSNNCQYLNGFNIKTSTIDIVTAQTQMYKEWIYNAAFIVYDLLQDKLNYNPQRIISPGWDDQDICSLTHTSDSVKITDISPLHVKIMETAYYSRCATGMIDIPKSEKRSCIHNEDDTDDPGYAQMLARIASDWMSNDINGPLYTSHSALFAPWGQYKYVGTGKQNAASPSFLALMIQRAQILNQPLQYEWALPTNRRHNLKVGKMDYEVPKKLLDKWQKLDGVGVNVITVIPELGLNIWGNSTLFEVPPATYQALANLSTRYLVNAVENIAYICGLSITFQYNNVQAYNKFYAGVTPLLDTMKNVGAIDDYYVKMAADINGLDQVNANTVIGKIYLVINGVINDIYIDLIALPPGVDLDQYKS
ncbi:MAG: hypothetical protein NC320_01985 [Clostridium sp.]|nr:hypothetical protein [Clostridium sp.]